MKTDRRLVVVLGMHRSGTSAITRALDVLGVQLGEDLHPAGLDNPKGFWEDRSIIALNEQLLRYKGSEHSQLNFSWQSFGEDPYIGHLRQQAVQLIAGRLDTHAGLWGFKDPRTCRLLAFWMSVFEEVGCQLCFVIALRNPMSVAASLAQRNNISIEKAYLLWLQHMLPAVQGTTGLQRIVVDYDQFLDAPYSQLERIARALHLELPARDAPALREFETAFLDAGLRHTRFSEADLLADSRALLAAREFYALMSSIARDEISLDEASTTSFIEQLDAQVSPLAPLVDYINFLEHSIITLRHAADAAHLEAAQSQQRSDEARLEIAQLNGALSEKEEAITERLIEQEQLHTQLNTQIQSLRQQLDHRNDQIADIFQSRSWRLMRKLQNIYTFPLRVKAALRWRLALAARRAWQHAPLSQHQKYRIKGSIFQTFAFALEKTSPYQNWKQFNASFSSDTRDPLPAADGLAPTTAKASFVPLLKQRAIAQKPAKLICFYLPQFHAIPENDAWWGEGFTEWTNVRPAQPQFVGHYQPRVPWELAYYNLLDPAIQERQVELARLYGIEGFCFYFYWFGGKRLLEAPTENYLRNTALDLPFCLCWANENWSRRWDGLDSEILIAQQHSPEDDLAFIAHVAQYMRDARYIRIDGRPLLLVYRPSLLPSARQTAERWRTWCRANGVGEIYLAYTQSFEVADPGDYGFDAAIEFPPNNSAPPNITDGVEPLTKEFGSIVYDWNVFVERSRNYQAPAYKLFRSVCPSWDNTARRKNRGTVFLNSSPERYQQWLENAIDYTREQFADPDERLIFVNAWNEWAEGACLEPDARYGYAYLQATRNALTKTDPGVIEAHRKVVLVAHDAHPHGAQFLALNLAKVLSGEMGFEVELVCLGDGPLKVEYAKWATVHDLSGVDPDSAAAHRLAKALHARGHRSALVNTTVGGHFLQTLVANGLECTALIHELRGVIEQYGLHSQARAIAEHAARIVFPAHEVATSFEQVAPMDPARVTIRPQGVYKRFDRSIDRVACRKKLRQMLDIPDDSYIVLGVGYADHRKGIDLFVEAGLQLAGRISRARWVWIGHWEQQAKARVDALLEGLSGADNPFIFPGLQTDTSLFYGGADVFALTSREDPFPSVVLEALDAGVPVVGFDDAGGFIDLLRDGCGRLVPKENHVALAESIGDLLEAPDLRDTLGARGAELIAERFSFRHYIFDLLDYLGHDLPRVSVIVPNFNYAHYLPQRLSSITRQTFPIFEIVFCDDHSADNSIEVARDILRKHQIDYTIVENNENSGSVFRQWKAGVDRARGTHVWIAEADDFCSPQFLGEVMKGFDAPEVVLSYCESKQVNASGATLADNYLDYVADVDRSLWKNPFIMSGVQQIEAALCIKNTIPNVSGVVFDRGALKAVLDQNIELISSYRIAGDWLVYVLLLQSGRIAFSPQSLNMHRRHGRGVTLGSFNQKQIDEIVNMQNFVASKQNIDPQKSLASREYIKQLSRQFGLRSV